MDFCAQTRDFLTSLLLLKPEMLLEMLLLGHRGHHKQYEGGSWRDIMGWNNQYKSPHLLNQDPPH